LAIFKIEEIKGDPGANFPEEILVLMTSKGVDTADDKPDANPPARIYHAFTILL
jgi:hypothetical protein